MWRKELKLIVAYDRNQGIGKDGKLAWKIPSDMRWFKKITHGETIVMGRKTFESIGKPLEGRLNIIISKTMSKGDGYLVLNNHEDFLKHFNGIIIGGSEIYNLFLPYVGTMYITEIDMIYDCDTFFPLWEKQHWGREVLAEDPINRLTFCKYTRI